MRRSKTEAKVSQRAEVALLVVGASTEKVNLLKENLLDLRNAGGLREIKFEIADLQTASNEIATQVTLATPLN